MIQIMRSFFGERGWMPRVDIVEGKNDISIKAEIPGCDAKDIDVKLEGRILRISGQKSQEGEKEEGNLYRSERYYGSFSRTLELPTEVDPEKIDALYRNGVLNLVFRKTGETKGKKIEIKTS